MGREIKRVALTFDHPLGETWPGFRNPHYRDLRPCPACGDDGASPAGKLVSSLWYRHLHDEATRLLRRHEFPDALRDFADAILRSGQGWSAQLDEGDIAALIQKGRLSDFTHRPRTQEQAEALAAEGGYWMPESNGYTPTPAEVNAWSRRGFGHDSINSWICVAARAARYDMGTTCATCQGEGHARDEGVEARIEAWEPTEPPAGPGWQVWETVSEGSPVSPVFPHADAVIDWLVGEGYSVAAARAFVRAGSAMSGGMVGGKVYRDIETLTMP